MIRIKHQLFTPLLVLSMVISGYNTSYSETYTDSMGNELTQEQYEKRLSLCYDVKSTEMILSGTNC